MKLVIISDTHENYKKLNLPEGDILIHCGDIDINEYMDLIDYNEWLGKQLHKFRHIIQIAGNHDTDLEKRGILQIEEILTNCIYLENNGIELMGVKFWGSPITPEFNNWVFMKSRGEEIKKYWDLIPNNTNILITHGPSYGILDIPALMIGKNESTGCLDLKKRIEEIKPKLHVFGHIHGSYGIKELGETTYINASVMNEEYKVVNNPILYDYN